MTLLTLFILYKWVAISQLKKNLQFLSRTSFGDPSYYYMLDGLLPCYKLQSSSLKSYYMVVICPVAVCMIPQCLLDGSNKLKIYI